MAAAGYTALYDALLHARKVLDARADDQGRIQAVVLLSDGQNTTGSTLTLEEVKRQYGEGDIPIFPIAYGTDADKEALTAIADFTRTLLIEGSSADINQIFENMSRYF
jgi:Ca-activated chloride channel family protein